MNEIVGQPDALKIHNRKRVLAMLREADRMEVADLAAASGLSRTSVSKILRFFASSGLVRVVGKGLSTKEGGKKPEIYAFDGRAGYICALSIRQQHSFGGVTDLSGRLLINMRMPHPRDADIDTIVGNVAAMIAAAANAAELSREKLAGVALGIDGLIDREHGLVNRALHFPSWGENVPLTDLVRIALSRSLFVSLDNALAQLALGELHEDPMLAGRRVLTLYHGDSVYAGLVEPVQGGHPIARALHIGQMRLEGGKEYESLSSAEAVLRRANENGVSAGSLEALVALGERGVLPAQALVRELLELHCSALYNVMLLFSPEIIVLQGDYAALGQSFCDALHALLLQQKPLHLEGFAIRPSKLDMNRGFLIGAAMSTIETYFDDDRIYER